MGDASDVSIHATFHSTVPPPSSTYSSTVALCSPVSHRAQRKWPAYLESTQKAFQTVWKTSQASRTSNALDTGPKLHLLLLLRTHASCPHSPCAARLAVQRPTNNLCLQNTLAAHLLRPCVAATTDAELTPDLLLNVLGRLTSQRDRLAACALVSRAWHAAAVAASPEVTLYARSPDKVDALRLYLKHHGANVSKLTLGGSGASEAARITLKRPLAGCSQLRELHISSCNVDLATFLSGLAGSLTRLEMRCECSTLPAPPSGLAPLSKLTALQHLDCVVPQGGRARFPAGVLCRLTRLTHIDLQRFSFDKPALRGLNLLSNLQYLRLGPAGRWSPQDDFAGPGKGPLTPEALASVSGLQHLTLLGLAGAPAISSSTVPGLSSMTALKDLSINDCSSFRPAGLLNLMTGLTHLYLHSTVTNTLELLRLLPRLQHLEYLGMWDVFYGSAPTPAHFGALTASSKLQELEMVGALLPAGAFAAMFGGSKRLPGMTRLVFNTYPEETLGTPELQAIARCCPALRSLVARGCVMPGTNWGVLAPLQHLNSLTASHVSDAEAAGLARLVGLDSLRLVPPDSSISILGVQQLTALRKLSLFTVYTDDSLDNPMAEFHYESEVRAH